MDYRPLFGDMSAPGNGDANRILTSGQQYPAPTSLQIFAIAIIFVFPALALVVVTIRAAGRIAIRQFGWGKRPYRCVDMCRQKLERSADNRTQMTGLYA